MKVYAVRIEDISEVELANLMKNMPIDKQVKINKFIFKKDKIRAVISEILLRSIMIKEFGVNEESLVIRKNAYGKPYLEGCENVNFNISHSGDFVVCAIDSKAIGIDIEQILDIDYKSIAESFFSKEDLKFILNDKDETNLERFYEIWTLKESYIKAIGRGLSIPLNSFGFKLDNDRILLINNDNEYIFKKFEVFQGYKLSVCSSNNEITNDIIEISQKILINKYYKLIQKK